MNSKPTYQELEKEVKLLKEALKKNKDEVFFRLLTENSTDGMSVINRDGVSIYRTPSTKNINGFTVEDIEGKSTFDYVHKDDIHALKNQLSKVLEKPEKIVNLSYRGYHKNGKLICYEGTAKNMLHSPIINGVIVNFRNVTEKVLAEKKLKNSEEYFKSLTENSSDVIIIVDKTGKSIYRSPSYKRVMGYDEDEMLNKNIFDLIHEDDRERLQSQLKNSFQKHDKVQDVFVRAYHKDGTLRYFEGTGRNMLSSPIIKGIVINYRDVTERKEAEQALIDSETRLRESNKTKDKFFSIIAHDLKSPFNAIIGFSNLLYDNFDNFNEKQQKEFIKIIKESSENAYKLLENLLTWSRSQQGTLNFLPQNENLYLLIYTTIELLKQSLRNKNIKLNNKISEEINVFVDKNMVLTIFRNLISNAIKFTKKGGEVSLFSKIINKKNKKQFVEITIKDTGVGISSKIIKKLFSISENVSTNGTENETGTGLGLIICKEFIDKHLGKIWVKSEVGKGSSFVFTLPMAL